MSDLDVLARTLWGEARGEGYLGMAAVGLVVCNRADHPRWWGTGISGCCQAPKQFSCWNAGDANRRKLLAVGARDAQFADATEIAARLLYDRFGDVTNGADHYYAATLSAEPAWAIGRTPVAIIGRHLFFRLEL